MRTLARLTNLYVDDHWSYMLVSVAALGRVVGGLAEVKVEVEVIRVVGVDGLELVLLVVVEVVLGRAGGRLWKEEELKFKVMCMGQN